MAFYDGTVQRKNNTNMEPLHPNFFTCPNSFDRNDVKKLTETLNSPRCQRQTLVVHGCKLHGCPVLRRMLCLTSI